MKLFDEKEAISFIRANVSALQLSDDDILSVIDAIFDYYDENEDLDLDFDDAADSDDDVQAIVEYVTEAFGDCDFPESLIQEIVKAELDYEQSLL
ncbi:MAG: hypothetical protein K2M54_05145 [Muribaculaceae bacterium]|nr:hypothetical protein [Muribaculaceae bacterium]